MTKDVESGDADGIHSRRAAELTHLQQSARIAAVRQFFAGPWVIVRHSDREVSNALNVFACLIPPTEKQSFLDHVGWDFRSDDLQPHIQSVSYGSGEQEVSYLQHGNTRGAEPLFHLRFHSNQWPSSIEVAEEFRLFFNLHHDQSRGVFLHCDVHGREDEVVIVRENEVRMKLAYLARYLRAKQMDLAVQIEGHASSTHRLLDLALEPTTTADRGDNYHYELSINHWDLRDKFRSVSRLLGKSIMPCPGPIRWDDPYARKYDTYADFIVGTDAEGVPILANCDCEGGEGRSNNFLTPVFFKREVLQKYFTEPARYTVEDGRLSCGGLWGLRMDNDHPRRVGAWLGDLGHLNSEEQAHWRAFNVVPDDRFSATFITRNIQGWFADPTMPDLVFKTLYPRINEAWEKRFTWPLWRKPHPQDQYIFNKLHVSLGDEQSEFDEQTLLLAKSLVDFLNEEQLAAGAGTLLPDAKGISKLAGFLLQAGMTGGDTHVQFLRDLQRIRSKGVHRKTGEYEKALEKLGIAAMHRVDGSHRLFEEAVNFLRWLEDHLSPK